jgi:hypothetical protein
MMSRLGALGRALAAEYAGEKLISRVGDDAAKMAAYGIILLLAGSLRIYFISMCLIMAALLLGRLVGSAIYVARERRA